MSMNYAQMVEGCRKRDAKAQRALYDEFAPMVMGICMRFCCNRDEANDMLQDSFVSALEHIGSVHDSGKLRTWVYTIAVNRCVQHLQKMRRECIVDDMPLVADESTLDMTPYSMGDIVEAMSKVPPKQRLVFNLCLIEELSHEEVAKRLGMTTGNVRVMLFRARAAIRNELEKMNKTR